jgi:hypothetical protein
MFKEEVEALIKLSEELDATGREADARDAEEIIKVAAALSDLTVRQAQTAWATPNPQLLGNLMQNGIANPNVPQVQMPIAGMYDPMSTAAATPPVQSDAEFEYWVQLARKDPQYAQARMMESRTGTLNDGTPFTLRAKDHRYISSVLQAAGKPL